MNDIDEFLEKRCKNDVLRKKKNVFQLQIMRYVIKTHQKMLFGQIFGQKTFLVKNLTICPKSRSKPDLGFCGIFEFREEQFQDLNPCT